MNKQTEPAQAVNITTNLPHVMVDTETGPVKICRQQNIDHQLTGYWARTSRPCPKSCIQPNIPAEGVHSIGELELLHCLVQKNIVVVDSRTPEWFHGGTIPGAINIPFTEAVEHLDLLGCHRENGEWECTNAKPVALFCNGVWCGQSPTAIRAMIKADFPADRIYYFRNGMQGWHLLGLTVTAPVAGVKCLPEQI